MFIEIILLSFLIGAIFVLLFRKGKSKRMQKIPEVTGLPLFGPLLQLNFESIHETFFTWSKRYGNIYQFKILGKNFVSLNSCAYIREAFLREPSATISSARPPSFFGQYALDNYSDIAWCSYDREFQRKRKLVYRLIHTYSDGLKEVEEMVVQKLDVLLKQVNEIENKDIDPAFMVEEFLMNTVEMLIIGKCSGKNGKMQRLLSEIDQQFNHLSSAGVDVLYGLFPFLRFLPLEKSKLLKNFIQNKQKLMMLAAEISKDNPQCKGMYQSMMEMVNGDQNGQKWLTEIKVQNILMNMSSAELQQAMQAEVDAVVGHDRGPRLEDKRNCPLLEAVLIETLRYISHVPLAVLHYTSDDCDIAGYHIPKGTIVIPNLWAAHRNETEWDQPWEFRPQRFLDEDGHLLPATDPIRLQSLSFGVGKRSCVGEVFARTRIFLFLATFMQHFTILPPLEEQSAFSTDNLQPSLVMLPKPYKVRFEKRQKMQ